MIADYRQNHDVSQFLGFISANTIVGRVATSTRRATSCSALDQSLASNTLARSFSVRVTDLQRA